MKTTTDNIMDTVKLTGRRITIKSDHPLRIGQIGFLTWYENHYTQTFPVDSTPWLAAAPVWRVTRDGFDVADSYPVARGYCVQTPTPTCMDVWQYQGGRAQVVAELKPDTNGAGRTVYRYQVRLIDETEEAFEAVAIAAHEALVAPFGDENHALVIHDTWTPHL